MGTSTTTFDDGSTFTWNDDYSYMAATEAPPGYLGATWSPQAVNPAAGSWDDVLKFGLARVIDAKTRPLYPNNTLPYYQNALLPYGTTAGGISLPFLLLIAAIAYVALK